MGMYVRYIIQEKLSLKRSGHQLRGMEEIHPENPHLLACWNITILKQQGKFILQKNASKMHL
jgi:hypothetical protein